MEEFEKHLEYLKRTEMKKEEEKKFGSDVKKIFFDKSKEKNNFETLFNFLIKKNKR